MSTTRPIRLLRLTRARTFAHGALAAGGGLLIAFVVFLVATLGAWITVDTHRALVTAIGTSDSAELVLETRVGSDSAAQDEAAASVIHGALGTNVLITREPVGSDGELVRYVITPDAATLTPAAVTRIAAGITSLEDRFRTSTAAVGGLTVSGGLAATMADAGAGAVSSAAISPIPLAIIAVLGWFAVMELSRAWGRARARETSLLTARGMSRGQKAALTTGEMLLITLAASVVGFAAAFAMTWLRAGVAAPAAIASGLPLTVTAVVVLAVTAGTSVARAAESEAQVSARAARFTQVASVGALALIVFSAVLAVWQLFATRDTPVDAPWRVALSSLAPILSLIAAALIAVLISAPLARAVAAVASTRPGLSPTLPARNVARRLPAYATAVALVVITVSGAVFAGSYVATWEKASGSAAALSAGAEVRVQSGFVSPADLREANELGTAAAVYAVDVVVGEIDAGLVAISQDRLADVVIGIPGLVDPAALAQTVATDSVALELPPNATELEFTVTAEGVEQPVYTSSAQIWVADDSGVASLVTVTFSDAEETSRQPDPNDGFYGDLVVTTLTGTATLPAGVTRILSVGLTAVDGGRYDGTIVTFTAPKLSAIADDETVPIDFQPATPSMILGGSVRAGTSSPYGVLWSTRAAAPVVPIVVSQSFATELSLDVGDTVELRVDGTGRSFSTKVAAIVEAIPGVASARGVLLSLDAAVQAAVPVGTFRDAPTTPPAPNEIWLAGVDPAEAADALGADVSVPTDVAAVITGGLITTWWIAPVGAALLASIALIAMLASLTATRAGEVLILRAVGVAPRAQARMRIVEAATVVTTATLLGALAGWGMSALTVPLLVSAAVPGSRQLTLAMNPVIIGAVIGIIAVAFVISAIVIAGMVRKHATSTRIAEAAE